MDQSTLVDVQVDDGRRIIEQFAADGNAVHAAFWVKTADEGLWFLYIATDIVERDGPMAAYRAINRSLDKLGDCWISGSDIKMISTGNPVTKDVLTMMARHSGRLALRSNDKIVGSMPVAQLYIYPAHLFSSSIAKAMTTEEIGQAILRLMNRGAGKSQPTQVTMKNGSIFRGIPYSIRHDTKQKAVIVSFIDEDASSSRDERLDDIASLV